MSSGQARRQDRHQARILAMQALYEADIASHSASQALERLAEGDEVEYRPATVRFARRLIEGVTQHLAEIDHLIMVAAPAWPIDQMAKIDKSILRVAIYELLHERGVPYKAAINEAVEVAKLFGSDSAPRFVNGVLGTIVAQHGGGGLAAATDDEAER